MDMDLTYQFRVQPPGARVGIASRPGTCGARPLSATLASTRVELTDNALLNAFFSCPLLTLKVIGGIHWEALQIFLKGIGLRHRPPPPVHPVTVARSDT